jgi:hypothetical protein
MRVEVIVKDVVQIVKILEAFDLMRSFRGAAKVAGCDHHTVKRLVALRDAGALSLERPLSRGKLTDAFVEHIEGWMEQSQGRVRADVCFEKLLALGFTGSARTVRRAVASARRHYRLGRVRVFRPWLPEPGLWLQFDWAKGPPVAGRATSLFCAWLAWSRYRLVIPTWDRTIGSLVLCLDQAFRRLGGCPTYLLTDNERSVTDSFVAGLPVRNARSAGTAARIRSAFTHSPPSAAGTSTRQPTGLPPSALTIGHAPPTRSRQGRDVARPAFGSAGCQCPPAGRRTARARAGVATRTRAAPRPQRRHHRLDRP